MSASLDVKIEWLEAPGVTTPELAATWARYEIWAGGRCITQVEAADGTFRRSVYGSLYPLAYWIASNWWLLTSHVRPSATETRYWTWQNTRTYPWLSQHNLRGAGDGMAWPDLTLVPEGAVTRIVWTQDHHRHLTPVRFASDGYEIIPTDELQIELAGVVDRILERLAESGLRKTPLAEEWSAVGKADDEEKAFCRTVARVGLDPYSVSDEMADAVVGIAGKLPVDIRDDFFDSADVTALAGAAAWARRAIPVAGRAAGKAARDLQPFYQIAEPRIDIDRPWTLGYAMARQLRNELNVRDADQFDVSPWVGLGDVSAPSYGIQGLVTVSDGRCGAVLGARGAGAMASRFGQARALGRALTHPGQEHFILSAARGRDERIARAFAAELLAPAEGIRLTLDSIGQSDDSALETIAQHYRVSPLVVRHQYDNQIAISSH